MRASKGPSKGSSKGDDIYKLVCYPSYFVWLITTKETGIAFLFYTDIKMHLNQAFLFLASMFKFKFFNQTNN